MWEIIAIIIAAAGMLWWFMLRRGGQIAFWNRALRHPDLAYDFFASNDVWRVFVAGLPADFREQVPADDWVGPFPMYVPKLGNQKVLVFGRKDTFQQSQQALLHVLKEHSRSGG